MKKIEKGIVFSNDIYRIMNSQNALDFNYEENGFIIPSKEKIEFLRRDFAKDINRIFNNEVTIFTEEEMESFLYKSLEDCRDFPHCVFR